ncbi:MAG: flagellar basal body rod protein FlgB [Treponemataceae bacterium]|nr:MAG: flagellar basal body rod protein FlgB [Treponemataceae bacterium]
MNSFERTVDVLHRAMDVSTLRYNVAADNLSKSEVPNFKRTGVNFESELKKAFESEKRVKADALIPDSEKPWKFRTETPIDYRTIEPRRVKDYFTTEKANGNNVNAEQEAMDILKTQLNFRLLTQLQAFEFQQVRTALKK